ncbi:MAG TPA: histidine kinase [Pyrinomonadaceae bacterium]|nr:histidine kinase [Pyrinomonadaceae bacterium]
MARFKIKYVSGVAADVNGIAADAGRRYCGEVRLPRLRPWMIVSAAWIGPAVFAVINRIAQARLQGWEPATLRELLFEFGDWLLYAFLTPFVFAVSKRWPLTRPHLISRALLHFFFSLLFCVAWATCGQVLRFILIRIFAPDIYHNAMQEGAARFWLQFGVEWLSWIFTTLPFGVAVYLCVVGIEHATRYFIDAREREVQVARLSEQLSSARFAALQAQLNPHFLFNTLNTITVLVRDNDRQGAVSIIEHLSELLRRTLSRHQANEVTLGEEFELVRQYVAIEQARFSDRLRPEFRIPESLMSATVPSFSLQHLVENAIRHGIAKATDAGLLLVTASRSGDLLEINVINDGVSIDPNVPPPPGHGIENTRERLRALYGDEASLEIVPRAEGGTIATLRVPYREMRPEPDGESS